MPLYEFECQRCGRFDESRPLSASARPCPCPKCRRPAARVLSAPAIVRAARPSPVGREPRLVRGEPRPAKPKPHHRHGRPWMLGH